MYLCILVYTRHCQQIVFASVHIKIWSFMKSGPPVCMCQYGIMEGAMNYWTLPRVYHSYESTWAQHTGPNKQYFECSIFHLWCKVLSCTGHSTSWVYPNCLWYEAKWSPRHSLQARLASRGIWTSVLPWWCVKQQYAGKYSISAQILLKASCVLENSTKSQILCII